MELNLNGKTALVFGSTQGIGHAIASKFAAEGARVILVGRSADKLENTLKTLKNDGHDILVVNQEDVASIEAGAEKLKNQPIDILVNNTGGPNPGLVSEESWQNFEMAITKQLRCSQTFATALLPGMRERKFGRIVNIISTSVKVPIPGLGVSNTVRGAVASWAKTLSMEVAADGVTVNNLLPGFIKTGRLQQIIESNAQKSGRPVNEVSSDMQKSIPAGRFGEPEEMANMALFLCSEAAAYVNGTSIRIDGGRTGSI
ncbi:MAG: SDR family oxidoreductase [Cytophagales bacterium]|nr:SDR family oxidoreductase [Cytophagales bacterium]